MGASLLTGILPAIGVTEGTILLLEEVVGVGEGVLNYTEASEHVQGLMK
jgi:hypothetical protein